MRVPGPVGRSAGGATSHVLLNPGPVILSERVRRALLEPDLCHREPEFAALQGELRRRLLEVYGLNPERWAAVLLTGSGTAAVEAMLTSLVPRGGRLLVVENGVYGERISRIARAHGIAGLPFRRAWDAPVEASELAGALGREPGATQLAVVHHETTTGRLNDLAAIGALCREREVELLVDAVSSFGAEEIDFEGWGVTACAGVANKCLHGAPGVSFVIVRRRALPPAGEATAQTLYLDVASHCRAQDRGETLFTPAVQGYRALLEALRELAETGGWPARRARYARLGDLAREGLGRLGIRPLLPVEASSVVLRAYRIPDGLGHRELHDGLKERGFVVYGGQGELARRIFRVATMGAVTERDVEDFVTAAAEVLRAKGSAGAAG